MIEINEIGNVYGWLTVISKGEKSTRYGIYWLCKCKCGNQKEILGSSLRYGQATACGCKIGYNTGPKRKNSDRVLRQHYAHYRNSKRARQLGFNLTLEQFENICRQNCYYCNANPQTRKYKAYRPKGGASDLYAYDNLSGIDRLDNTKGYTLENSIPCCGKCNIMKGNYTEEQFFEHIKQIYEFKCNRA